MSNNNKFWGKRFGGVKVETINKETVVSNVFRVKQLTSGQPRSGPHQIGIDPKSPIGQMAERQRKLFQQVGRAILYYNENGRRVASSNS